MGIGPADLLWGKGRGYDDDVLEGDRVSQVATTLIIRDCFNYSQGY